MQEQNANTYLVDCQYREDYMVDAHSLQDFSLHPSIDQQQKKVTLMEPARWSGSLQTDLCLYMMLHEYAGH
jgi:hypothetical protein